MSRRWIVAWADGSTATYRTGARGRFDLCYLPLHPLAGSPFASRTLLEMSEQVAAAGGLPVTDGPHAAAGWLGQGEVRRVHGAWEIGSRVMRWLASPCNL
jgi:hypothetical protein